MTYSSGGPGYPPAQQHGPYAPTTQFAAAKPEERPSKLPQYLLIAVVVLGLVGYLVSFGPVWKSSEIGPVGGSNITGGSFEIVALVLAALLAAIGLLPKQKNYTAIVAAVAVIGFLLSISELINKPSFLSVGWALIAILVLAGLQALAAVGALLLEAGVIALPPRRPKYEQYAPYGQYYGQPLGQPQQHAPQPQNFQQRPGYPQYGGYGPGAPTAAFPAVGPQTGPPTPPTGFPTYGQPPAPAPTAPQGGGAPTEKLPQQDSESAQSGQAPS
jgi:Family of unknown function (DUF5336)